MKIKSLLYPRTIGFIRKVYKLVNMGSTGTNTPLRIVVGSDNAGVTYKDALKETLKKHKGVADVIDVGVNDANDSTSYPHAAVDAARKIKNGEVGQQLRNISSSKKLC